MTPTRSPRTVLGRVVVVAFAATALLLGATTPASAHAYLERTNPADGSVVARAPERLALYFSEHVVPEATTIEVVDGSGRVLELGDLRLESDEPEDIEVPSVVTASLPDLPRDAYRVRWSTLSSDDLHRTSGFFVFGVGTDVRASGFAEPSPRLPESGLRWLLLLGLGLVLGSELVQRLVATQASVVDGARTTLRRAGPLGALTALVASLALMADEALASGLSWNDLVQSGYAARWSVREAGLVILLVAVVSRGSRARGSLLVVGTAAACVGSALLGHAGADAGAAYTRVAATALHLGAMLTWAGAVLCLALVVRATARHGSRFDLEVRVLLRRFARPAVTCLGIGVATGLYLSSSTVVSVDAALLTTYGRTLMVKLALVAVMVLLAWSNHRRLRGRHDLELPDRGVLAEAVTAVLVLAATAVLTSAQPATEPVFLTPPAATAGPVSGDVDDLHMALGVEPNRPGVNVVSVDVFDTRRPAPSRVTAVDVVVDGTTFPASPLGDGRWTVAGVDLSAGPRLLGVTVHRPGLSDAALHTRWTVGTGLGARRPLVSTLPLRGPLRGLAGLALLGLVASLLVISTRPGRTIVRGRPADEVNDRSSGPRPRSQASLQDRSPVP